ncbi:hypothetical protein LZK98_11550 [Sphingomonas cannabina]|uniref:hypothetical protein n=1 Tax=Sphingomonas cannabina TaxID=2899123 RepID=UPI001F32BBBB|nr:hypothetical protein [Sphingomonas cannabina]UIJ43725.1 hypothetical protein LZK98_11550 [Sphingomonas cannabina]
MATPDGRVAFETGGKAYELQFTINRMCVLEDHLDTDIMRIGMELDRGVSMKTLRALFWAGLGEKEMTLAHAGEVIDALGVKRAVAAATEAFRAALADDEADDDGEGKGERENPRKAATAG